MPIRLNVAKFLGPVRIRATLAAVLVVMLALVVAGGVLRHVIQTSLLQSRRDAATLRARDVASLVETGELPVSLAFPGEDAGLAQVVSSNGSVVAASANLAGEPPMSTLHPLGTQPSIETIAKLPVGEPGSFLVVALTVRSTAGQDTVYVAVALETVNDAVDTLTRGMAIGFPLLLLVVAITTRWVIGRALQPVDGIRKEVAEITAGSLNRRVPEPETHDEIAHLATTMNVMLDRLESAVDRQRRFTADASHELRSPLAAMRTQLEVASRRGDRTSWPLTVSRVLEDQTRLEHLVSDLLLLAKLDAHRSDRPAGLFDFAELVDTNLASIQPASNIAIEPSIHRPIIVNGDAQQLSRVLRNLTDNALRHATAIVDIQLTHTTTDAVLDIIDDGHGIPIEERINVFERFTRLDDARQSDEGGTGLGLAIAAEIVCQHHGTITILDTTNGAHFRVTIPLADLSDDTDY